MASRIAILGWGSLLWEDGNTFDDWHEPWQHDGPFIRIEFSRISSSRGGALTLVIDPENGVPVPVAWCLSRRQNIREAVEDLREREKTTPKHIGTILTHEPIQCRDGETGQIILSWATERELAGVVWTDLPSNFSMLTGEPFSVTAAMRYLKSLSSEPKIKAIEYFQRAPSFVQTPTRDAFARQSDTIAQPRS